MAPRHISMFDHYRATWNTMHASTTIGCSGNTHIRIGLLSFGSYFCLYYDRDSDLWKRNILLSPDNSYETQRGSPPWCRPTCSNSMYIFNGMAMDIFGVKNRLQNHHVNIHAYSMPGSTRFRYSHQSTFHRLVYFLYFRRRRHFWR